MEARCAFARLARFCSCGRGVGGVPHEFDPAPAFGSSREQRPFRYLRSLRARLSGSYSPYYFGAHQFAEASSDQARDLISGTLVRTRHAQVGNCNCRRRDVFGLGSGAPSSLFAANNRTAAARERALTGYPARRFRSSGMQREVGGSRDAGGEHGISRQPIALAKPDDPAVPVVTYSYAFYFCIRGCGCNGHPAFPAPHLARDLVWQTLGPSAPRERAAHALSYSKRRKTGIVLLAG